MRSLMPQDGQGAFLPAASGPIFMTVSHFGQGNLTSDFSSTVLVRTFKRSAASTDFMR